MAFLAINGSDLNEFIRPCQEAAPRKKFLKGSESPRDDWYDFSSLRFSELVSGC